MKKKQVKSLKPKYNILACLFFMLKTAWQHRKSVIFLCLAIAFSSAGKSIVDLLITPAILHALEASFTLPRLIGIILGFSLVHFFFFFMQGYLGRLITLPRNAVRVAILQKIADKGAYTSYANTLDTAFLDMQEKARRCASGPHDAAEHIWMVLTTLMVKIICFIFYLTLLSNLHPLLMAVVLFTSLISYYINKCVGSWSYRHKEEDAALHKQFYYLKQVSTDRQYAKDLRIFGLQDWLGDLVDASIELRKAFLFKRERAYIWIAIADLLLTFFRNGIAYGYLLWLTLSNGMGADAFLLYFSAVGSFAQLMSGLLVNISELHKDCLDLSVLQEFLAWPEPFLFENGSPIPQADSYELRLEHVSYRYPKAEMDTLTELDFVIHPGERLAIVGLNGAGKTTLVKLLCGFLDPTKGRVLLNGEDIRQYNRREYYQLFSAVFQDYSILEATIAENVAQQVDDINEARVWSCLAYAGIEEMVQQLPQKLQTHIGRSVYPDGIDLSGGETQRLILARSLYKNGPILILDEPTAALDPIAEHNIYMKYQEMSHGKTSLFISHRLASTRFCDRILLLENGRIAEEGTHQSLLTLGGKYTELFRIQSQYYKEGGTSHAKP